VEAVAVAFDFDDAAALGEPVEGGAGESSGGEDLGPGLEQQVGRDDETRDPSVSTVAREQRQKFLFAVGPTRRLCLQREVARYGNGCAM
jgi:hypothetical protein